MVILGPFTGTWAASGGISDSGTLVESLVNFVGNGQLHIVRDVTGALWERSRFVSTAKSLARSQMALRTSPAIGSSSQELAYTPTCTVRGHGPLLRGTASSRRRSRVMSITTSVHSSRVPFVAATSLGRAAVDDLGYGGQAFAACEQTSRLKGCHPIAPPGRRPRPAPPQRRSAGRASRAERRRQAAP
jgi:hypothetical protein